MTPTELYTEERCRVVGDLLREYAHKKARNNTGKRCWYPMSDNPAELFRSDLRVPQYIREALAAEGMMFLPDPEYNQAYVFPIPESDDEWYQEAPIKVGYDYKADPTARHALFLAAYEYAKEKE